MTNYGPTPSVSDTQPLVRHVHGGQTVDYTPSTDVAFGAVVIQGSMAGVALRAIPANTQGSLAIEGSFEFPKAASDGGMAVGTLAYWDASAQVATGTATANTYLGKVELTAATADTTVRVQMEAMANASGSITMTGAAVATVGAAGNSAATANALSVGMNVVTGADSTKGVVLPASVAGKIVIVKNAQAGQTLPVYPPTLSAINAVTANSALTMAAVTSAMFVCTSSTQWYTVPLLPS
jgi:predicted RecA/RadA family phage recombinase